MQNIVLGNQLNQDDTTSSIQRGVFKSLNQTHVTYLCVLPFYREYMAMGNDQCKSGTKILLSLRPDSLGILGFLSLLIETGFFYKALDLMSWLKKGDRHCGVFSVSRFGSLMGTLLNRLLVTMEQPPVEFRQITTAARRLKLITLSITSLTI